MALLDAFALARALERQSNLDARLANMRGCGSGTFGFIRLASWLFTPAYQSDSAALAWFRDAVMAPLSRTWPGPTVGGVGGGADWRAVGCDSPPKRPFLTPSAIDARRDALHFTAMAQNAANTAPSTGPPPTTNAF